MKVCRDAVNWCKQWWFKNRVPQIHCPSLPTTDIVQFAAEILAMMNDAVVAVSAISYATKVVGSDVDIAGTFFATTTYVTTVTVGSSISKTKQAVQHLTKMIMIRRLTGTLKLGTRQEKLATTKCRRCLVLSCQVIQAQTMEM